MRPVFYISIVIDVNGFAVENNLGTFATSSKSFVVARHKNVSMEKTSSEIWFLRNQLALISAYRRTFKR